jgi:large subunit ribosomal protein L23
MSHTDIHQTIIRPILTESSARLKDQLNCYVFETHLKASKPDIKAATEALFKVKVTKVRTMIVQGKTRRLGRNSGIRSNWKKAIVTVLAGQKIDLGEPAK